MGWAARTNPRSDEFARLSPAAQGLVEAQDGRVFAQHSPDAEELTDQQRIRELAAQIPDEAHLQRILDDVRPQSVRALVEAQIRPWCTFDRPDRPRILAGPLALRPDLETFEPTVPDVDAFDAARRDITDGHGADLQGDCEPADAD